MTNRLSGHWGDFWLGVSLFLLLGGSVVGIMDLYDKFDSITFGPRDGRGGMHVSFRSGDEVLWTTTVSEVDHVITLVLAIMVQFAPDSAASARALALLEKKEEEKKERERLEREREEDGDE